MKLKDFDFQRSNLELNGSNLESLAFSVVQKYKKEKNTIAICLPTLYEAQQFLSFLLDYLDEDDISSFLYDEVLRIDALGTSREMMYERLHALNILYNKKPGIVVFNSISLIRPIISQNYFASINKSFRLNDKFSRQDFLEFAYRAGYTKVQKVEHPGEFAIRGMIIDFFSPGEKSPTRIELDGNIIDDIRIFNPSTEISEKEIDYAYIGPASDLLFEYSKKEEIISHLKKELTNYKEYDPLYIKISSNINDIENSLLSVPYRLFKYYGDFHSIAQFPIKVYSYHKEECLAFIENKFLEEKEYFGELINGKIALQNEGVFLDYKTEFINLTEISENDSPILTSVPYVFTSIIDLVQTLRTIINDGYKIVLCQEKNRCSNLISYLEDGNIRYSFYPNISSVTIFYEEISGGFLFKEKNIIFLGSKEIYGLTHRNSRFLSRFKEAKIIHSYDDLVPGDYVVHEMHGIGRFEGVVTRNNLEYLSVVYKDNDKLLIPLVQFKLIKKYAGREGYAPTLDKLGGSTWLRRKSQIRSRLVFLTNQLLEISSKRKSEKGIAFPSFPEFEELFASAFPYELTSSQKKAWEEIKTDMEKEQPMDRLLSGDVGFGKTEIALRAAYKAILDSKQVILLCPTTVLCRQHYEVATQRFKGFGVHIACFSRFVPLSIQKQNIEKIKEGKINLIIGTHRLLSDEIKFKDIGLLIVDEEQRFGVAQKEKFKKIGGNIDVLTLTATPIPRTLQMSMLGVRDLSNLDEPPLNRLPIKTYVTAYNNGLIKEAISLELGRNGQVYYLHNRVNSLYSKANEVQKLFPKAKIGVAHGKMTPSEMSDVMNAFYDGEIDILVCTTIIETGLDVPNVNTMIVEDADHFGLSQLYQIKGRVGRSDRLAYAYFFYNPQKEINEDAKKRLKALKEFTELGSGYNIAKQDLNLRGAGDILGAEQAGFMDTVGFDSYQALLDEVIAQKKFMENGKKESSNGKDFILSFSIDSHVPESYADESSRITIYRELANILTDEELYRFAQKLKDVYGPYPLEVLNLLNKRKIEIMLSNYYVKDFKEDLGFYILTLNKDTINDHKILANLESQLSEKKDIIRASFQQGCLVLKIIKTKNYLDDLLFIITVVDELIQSK